MTQRARSALLCLGVLLWSAQGHPSAAADEPRPRPEGHAAPPAQAPHPPAARPPAPHYQATYPQQTQRPHATYPQTARPSIDGRGQVLDTRYNHGRYYPPVGTLTHSLPTDYRPYYRGGARYYFSGGVWYAPRGGGFVVVTPPVGLVISALPPFYSTVWIGGIPYYYADNAYYTWQPDQGGYAVVNPPGDADQSSLPPDGGDVAPSPDPSAQPDVIICPKNGQTKDQQAADEYECHNWATTQTGFDPTQPGGGVPAGDADRSHSNFDRAMSACLQGRGYQVN